MRHSLYLIFSRVFLILMTHSFPDPVYNIAKRHQLWQSQQRGLIRKFFIRVFARKISAACWQRYLHTVWSRKFYPNRTQRIKHSDRDKFISAQWVAWVGHRSCVKLIPP